jgi:hypothetical protein
MYKRNSDNKTSIIKSKHFLVTTDRLNLTKYLKKLNVKKGNNQM